jgi:Lsr2
LATRYVRQLVDDLDGTPAVEEIRFTVGSRRYLLHLSASNVAAFHATLEPWTTAAAKLAPVKSPRARTKESRDRAATIRAWAQRTEATGPDGEKVAPNGRLPAWVVAQHAAHAA